MLGSRTPPATIDGNIVISATLVYDNVYDSMLLSTFLEYNPYLPFRGTASSEKLLFLFQSQQIKAQCIESTSTQAHRSTVHIAIA